VCKLRCFVFARPHKGRKAKTQFRTQALVFPGQRWTEGIIPGPVLSWKRRFLIRGPRRQRRAGQSQSAYLQQLKINLLCVEMSSTIRREERFITFLQDAAGTSANRPLAHAQLKVFFLVGTMGRINALEV
jgi:hypothetical protein